MKKLLVITCSMLFFSSYNLSASAPDNLEATVIKVIRAFEQKDSATINQLIYRMQGLAIIYTPGSASNYEKVNDFSFDKPIPYYRPYEYNAITDYKLKYEILPEFTCGAMGWDKTGFYCDTLRRNHSLSSIAKYITEYNIAVEDEAKMSVEIARFEEMERHSHRIILATDDADLIFHLTLIDGKWYLSVLDRGATECDP